MLNHVSFVTSDADTIQEFYAKLGAVVITDEAAPDGLRRLVLEFSGGGRLQFWATGHMQPKRDSTWMEHISLEPDQFDLLVSSLILQGVPFSREVQVLSSGYRVAFIIDPDGRQVELLSKPA